MQNLLSPFFQCNTQLNQANTDWWTVCFGNLDLIELQQSFNYKY